MTKGVIYEMASFAVLLEKLQSASEGAGNLLDRSCIYATSDCSWDKTHSLNEYSVLVAGRAGGALRGNVHYRSTTAENLSKVLFTLARVMGLDITEIGFAEGRAASRIDALLA